MVSNYLLTKERPTEEQKEQRKKLSEKEKGDAARIERNRIKNLRGFAKAYHYLGIIFLWVVGAVILFGIFSAILRAY